MRLSSILELDVLVMICRPSEDIYRKQLKQAKEIVLGSPRRPLCGAGASGPCTGHGAAMGPLGPWRGKEQAPAQSQD